MGLPDRVSEWAREAAKRRNANVGAGERVELDQLVGKYSRYRGVLHDRRLVLTEKAAYFIEADGTEPTEVVPWKDVIVVELVRSVTGTCVLDILRKEALWGMRTVSCDFYCPDAEIWEMWISCLSVFAQGYCFRLEVMDDYAADNKMSVAGGAGGGSEDFSSHVRVAADDMRATMNWVRTQWSQITNARASEMTKDDGLFSIAKMSTERSESLSVTPTLSPVSRRPGEVAAPSLAQAPPPSLRKASASSESVNGMITDSRSTSASDMRSISAYANAESSTAYNEYNDSRFAAAAQ
jgi:hypothetical protein